MGTDERFMSRALELARVPAFTSPNPRVGAVVVRGDTILAEAAHEGPGTEHAEARALGGTDASGATLYVTLEPCVHHGRMPPCAPVVAAAGLRRVVVAMSDPDERVSGRGLSSLRDAGLDVAVGIMEDEARRLNAPYVWQRSTGRAYLTLKLALSLDGRLAAADGSSKWITGPEARTRVHRRRLEADAVLVGAGTVIADDPELTVRSVPAPRQPLRVVVDGAGRVPASARLFSTGRDVVVATTSACPHDVQTAWKEAGAEVVVLPHEGDGVDLEALLDHLDRRGVVEVLCEGGGALATSLLRRRLARRLELYYGPLVLGAGGPGIGSLAPSVDGAVRWRTTAVERLGDDVLVVLEDGRG